MYRPIMRVILTVTEIQNVKVKKLLSKNTMFTKIVITNVIEVTIWITDTYDVTP
jgi:hypothetical protein